MITHEHIVVDTDPCFEIDIVTRGIKSMNPSKNVIMQFDHNSERFGFSMPRYIEGHDMSECDKIEVHFINEDVQKKEKIKDKYLINDLTIDPEDNNKIKFTWLLSGNTSKLEGSLVFSIRFVCFDENDGTLVDYSWGTAIFSSILVAKGLFNDEYLIDENPDAFEQLKKELEEDLKGLERSIIEQRKYCASIDNKVNSIYYYGDKDIVPNVKFVWRGEQDDHYDIIQLENYKDDGVVVLPLEGIEGLILGGGDFLKSDGLTKGDAKKVIKVIVPRQATVPETDLPDYLNSYFPNLETIIIGDGVAREEYVDKKAEESNAAVETNITNIMQSLAVSKSLFGGRYLGSTITEAQIGAVRNGTLAYTDGDGKSQVLLIGDYWKMGGVNWRIVDFDYWLNTGETKSALVTDHHLVLMSDVGVLTGCIYDEESECSKGYYSSKGRAELKYFMNGMFSSYFPSYVNLFNHKERFCSNVVHSGLPAEGVWDDSTFEIPSEVMMLGTNIMGLSNNGGAVYNTVSKTQLALFRIAPKYINAKADCWLRDNVTLNRNVVISACGEISRGQNFGGTASFRPVFAIC